MFNVPVFNPFVVLAEYVGVLSSERVVYLKEGFVIAHRGINAAKGT